MLEYPGVLSVLTLCEYLSCVRVPTGRRGQDVIILNYCRNGSRLAGRHLPSFDEKHRPAHSVSVLLIVPLRLDVVLDAGAAVLGPAVDVQVDAEVEEGHRHKWGEELEGGGAEQEVPREIKLSVALVGRDDALADDRLPEDDGRAVQEERQHPDRHHLEHSLAGHVSLSSVFNLKREAQM